MAVLSRLLIGSLFIFLLSWLIPYLPWRPKRIDAYFEIYRIIFSMFRVWSMISTAATVTILIVYFVVSWLYQWRRQYTTTSLDQKAETKKIISSNEIEWEEIKRQWNDKKQKSNIENTSFNNVTDSDSDETRTRLFKKTFLSSIKVFKYVEEDVLDKLIEKSEIKSFKKGAILKAKRTEMIFITFGSFKMTFKTTTTTASSSSVIFTSGMTLTSFINVIRIFSKQFNEKSNEFTALQSDNFAVESLEDSQILVLNEESFVEMRKLSELSVAHLTQVILTRFKRATLPIMLNYFNLKQMTGQLLPYFIKRFTGNTLKISLSEILTSQQEGLEDKLIRGVFQYLVSLYELNHEKFTGIETILKAHMKVKTVEPGEIVQKEGAESIGAILVLEGSIKISFDPSENNTKTTDDISVGSVGDFVGVFSSLMGKCSLIRMWNAQSGNNTTKVVIISQQLLEMISERDPKLLFSNIRDYNKWSQNEFMEFIDMCLEWQEIPSGNDIFNDSAVYKVLHGRIGDSDGREFGIGSFIGEEMIFHRDRATGTNSTGNTMRKYTAIRCTELVKIPIDLIEGIVSLNINNATFTTGIIGRLLQNYPARSQNQSQTRKIDPIRTVCLLPVGCQRGNNDQRVRNDQIELVESVADELKESFTAQGIKWTSIDSGRAAELMGRRLFKSLGTLKMKEYLSSEEDTNKIILYIADGIFSPWTRQSIQQADLILLVGDYNCVIEMGDLEGQMLNLNPFVNVELCLVCRTTTCTNDNADISSVSENINIHNNNSKLWLQHRPWIKAHHHLHLPVFVRTTNESISNVISSNTRLSMLTSMIPIDLITNLIRKIERNRDAAERIRSFLNQRISRFPSLPFNTFATTKKPKNINLHRHSHRDDFNRLSRRILGKSIGLVLGGGGARGLAHIGIIKSLNEAGIHFDLIGGTSMGAFIGGLYSSHMGDHNEILNSVELFCRGMSSKWRQVLDLTYPATSWFTGHAFNRVLWKIFKFSGMEDFHVPFFVISTDLTRSKLQVHREGPAWQYIRASMSLSGFLPPVCDARDGSLLVDGGYLANVPIDLMINGSITELSKLSIGHVVGNSSALSASLVIAVDVGKASDRVPIYYGDSLSGWTVLWRKLKNYLRNKMSSKTEAGSTSVNSYSSEISIPLTLDEIQFRLAYASSAGLLSKTLKRSHAQLISDLNSSPNSYIKSSEDSAASAALAETPLPQVIYLRPMDIQAYGTLDFHKWKEIVDIGYNYGKRIIDEWRENGELRRILEFQNGNEDQVCTVQKMDELKGSDNNKHIRRWSF